jgi:dTDP-4-amino-4,6-dideoxygalactose transaminase
VDLSHVNVAVERGVAADAAGIVAAGTFTNGPQVARFEQEFARYCGATQCVGVSSGLDALRLGLIAAGLQPGDEVIVPALTFIATFEAITQAGGVPVVVDVTELDYNIDTSEARSAVGERTWGMVAVHLYGQMAAMRLLRELTDSCGLHLVEDACQAHGASRDGLSPGSAGDVAAFSFYPTKNLGAWGDAGALITDDPELAACGRALREHGQRRPSISERVGYTARMDTIQATVLLRKLPLLSEWNDQRRTIAAAYATTLADVGDLRSLPVPHGSDPVWHLYPIRTSYAKSLITFLAERGIGTGRHYPEPPHLSQAYAELGYRPGDFPIAEALAEALVSLPIYPGLRERHITLLTDTIKEFFARGHRTGE